MRNVTRWSTDSRFVTANNLHSDFHLIDLFSISTVLYLFCKIAASLISWLFTTSASTHAPLILFYFAEDIYILSHAHHGRRYREVA